jgi:hypothetical protein
VNSLKIQDAFEPYYEGRRNTFATIAPSAVEKASKLTERFEEARRTEREKPRDEAA